VNAGNAVVWNPWSADAAKMADVGEGEWERFVCIEAAQVEPAITLFAGQSFEATHRIKV